MRRYPSQIVGLPFVGKDGVHCHKSARFLRSGMALALERDPDNLHDPDAIAIFTVGLCRRWHLGYVPKRHLDWIGEQLDGGRPMRVSVDTIHRDRAGVVINVDLHVDLARKGEELEHAA